jgi:hypothetical protein
MAISWPDLGGAEGYKVKKGQELSGTCYLEVGSDWRLKKAATLWAEWDL